MKTPEEWQRDYEYADPQMVRDIQRDAWEAATKAQRRKDGREVRDGSAIFSCVPFLGETK